MNKEEAMKVLGYQLNMKDTDVYTPINYEAIETVLNELEKKDTVINEAISYMEETFELEDEKCITELYNILKKESEE